MTQGTTSTEPRLGSCFWTQFPAISGHNSPFASPVPTVPARSARCALHPLRHIHGYHRNQETGLEERTESRESCSGAPVPRQGEFMGLCGEVHPSGGQQGLPSITPHSVPPSRRSVPVSEQHQLPELLRGVRKAAPILGNNLPRETKLPMPGASGARVKPGHSDRGCGKNKRALKTQKFGSIMFLSFKSFYKYETWLWLSPNYRTA